MEIRYDEKEKQFRISPLPEDYAETKKGKKGKKEMTFVKPEGFVPLVGHNCLKTAAGYLAAAGGQWLPNSKSVSIVFVISRVMFMCIWHTCFAVRLHWPPIRHSAYG